MLSSKLTRAAHRAPGAAAISTSSSTAGTRTTQCLATRPTHQRRLSSSKASCPPDSSKSAPAAKATSSDDATQSPASAQSPPQRGVKRLSRNKRFHGPLSERFGAVKSKAPVNQWAGLPAVPSVQNLDKKDFKLSSFFSLHRPLSLTSTIPPPSSTEAFNNIFETQQQHDPWENGNSAERRPEDVIYTLHQTIETLEGGASNAQDEGVRWEVIQESPSNSEGGVKHLDGPPRMKSLDELVAQFRPFREPPAPQPFPEDRKSASGERKKASKQANPVQLRAAVRSPKQKHYETTIRVTETTTADGQRTYSAVPSPIVRIPDPEEQAQTLQQQSFEEPQQQRIRQPFIERMRRRQQLYLQAQHSKTLERMSEPRAMVIRRRAPSAKRIQMLLISVKRQRKLKMKKHKYKKLMKRTRTLRRRLDRT